MAELENAHLWQRMEAAGILQKGNFLLRSGQVAYTKFEFDVVNQDPCLLEDVSDAMADLLEPHKLDGLVGVPNGATPLTNRIAQKLGIPTVPVAKSGGGFRLQSPMVNRIALRSKKRLGLVDDALTTGGNILRMSRMPDLMGRVVLAGVVCDRREVVEPISGLFETIALFHYPIPVKAPEPRA